MRTEPNSLNRIWAACLALAFYSTGNFGFWNIFGIRREVQVLLTALIFVGFIAALPRGWKYWWNPLVLLGLLLPLREIGAGLQVADIGSFVITLMVTLLLLTGGYHLAVDTMKGIVWGAALFSVMGLIEAVIFFARPDIIVGTASPYVSDTGSAAVTLSHPIQYLGFNTGTESLYLLGHQFTRLNSFASEPSVLVATFLVPGFLALTMGGIYRVMGILILAFVIGPVESGTIWISCGLGAAGYGYLKIFTRAKPVVRRAAGIGLAFAALSLLIASQKIDIDAFTARLVNWGGSLASVTSTVESKTSSSTIRLTGMQEAYSWVVAHPWGAPYGPDVAGMAVVYAIGYVLGYPGVIICIWLYILILRRMGEAFGVARNEWVRFGLSGCAGAMLQSFFFSGYGWLSPAGFMTLTIIYIISRTNAAETAGPAALGNRFRVSRLGEPEPAHFRPAGLGARGAPRGERKPVRSPADNLYTRSGGHDDDAAGGKRAK